jgi:hypothetical protein
MSAGERAGKIMDSKNISKTFFGKFAKMLHAQGVRFEYRLACPCIRGYSENSWFKCRRRPTSVAERIEPREGQIPILTQISDSAREVMLT